MSMAPERDYGACLKRDGDTTKEVIITDTKTGGMKASKLARFDLIPSDAMWALAEHYGKGASKYADRNWEKGYAWSLSYAALQRHLHAWWMREDDGHDEAFGAFPHIVAVLWHACALVVFSLRKIGTDDRPAVSREVEAAKAQELHGHGNPTRETK